MIQANLPQQPTRPGWREALVALVLLGWLGFALAVLIEGETPHGRLSVKVVATETGAALPNARIYFYQGDRTWTYTTGKDGSFELASMPAGTYRATADSRAHRLEKKTFLLAEGEQKSLTLALPPTPPFLELIHPQPVFLPSEPVKIGLRGFVQSDALRMDVLRLQLDEAASVPTSDLFGLLDSIRLGWWRGQNELTGQLSAFKRVLLPVQSKMVPVAGRDVEGVFLQYIPFDIHTPGTYLVRLRAAAVEQVALVVITETGLVLKSTGSREWLAWTSHLKNGSVQPNLLIEAWGDRRLGGRTYSERLATARTGADGLARLRLGRSLEGVERVWVVAQSAATRQPLAWVGQYVGSAETTGLTGYLYSERPIYRPGNKVFLKGVLRLHGPEGYRRLAAGEAITVLVRDPDNNLLVRRQTRLSTFDTFKSDLTLDAEAKTGTYTVTAQTSAGDIEGSFEVAAYRKPTFQISLTPEQKFFTPSEQVRLQLQARYYFGMPVGESTVRYRVYRLPLYESGEALDEGAEAEGSSGEYGEYVMDGTTRTDGSGHALIAFQAQDLPAKSDPWSLAAANNYRYAVSVTLQAAGNEYAEGEANFLVVQGNYRVDLETEPAFAQPNQPVRVRVNLRDRTTGQPAGASYTWRTGTSDWRGDRLTIDWQGASGQGTTGADGKGGWQFTPSKAGDWVVELQTRDGQGNTIVERQSIWISALAGSGPQAPNAPPLQVLTDKRAYQVGETARVALRSRAQEATVLLTVEGDAIQQVQLVRLKNGAGSALVPVRPGYVPTAYIAAALVSNKSLVQQSVPLRIGTEARQLKIDIQADQQRYEPRGEVQLRVRSRTADGKPIQSKLSLAVVDESLYAIRPDNPTALFDTFYARRPNQVDTSYSFPWIALQGDKGSGETVRRNFPDTAFWLPQLVTDRNGVATVRFRLPDNLTEWRVTAMGTTGDLDVGSAVTRFTSAKSFAVRLSVPAVLTEGDEVTVSAVVSNNGEAARTGSVQFLGDSRALQIPAGQSQTVEWNWQAKRSGRIPLSVAAKSADGRQDGEERTVTVLPHVQRTTLTKNVTLASGETVYGFQVPAGFRPDASRLVVRLAPSIFSQLLGTLDYLVAYPYGCTEQTMSRFLPGLLVQQVLAQKNIHVPELEKRTPGVVRSGLTRLYRFQHSEGGWGWWENDSDDLFMSAYVMHGLTAARQAGVAVNEEVFNLGRESLDAQVRTVWKEGFAKKKERFARDTYAFALFALAESGGKLPNRVADLAGFAPQLTPYGQAVLVLALDRWGESAAAGGILEQTLTLAQRDAAGLYWLPLVANQPPKKDDWYGHNWLNEAETTAWVLNAVLHHGETPVLGEGDLQSIVNWLIAHRRGGWGWESTKDSAAALEALVAYAGRYERPLDVPATLHVLLGGKQAAEVRFDSLSTWFPEVPISLPVGQLKVGDNQLRIAVEGVDQGSFLYASVRFEQAVQLAEDALPQAAGPLKLERTYALLRSGTDRDGNPAFEETPLADGASVTTGSLIRVHVRVSGWDARSESDISHLIVEDPLPGGFRTTEGNLPSAEDEDNSDQSSSDYTTEVRDDRTIGYYRQIYGKTLEFDYLLRAEVPGEYHVLPARLWSMYADWQLTGREMRVKVTPEGKAWWWPW